MPTGTKLYAIADGTVTGYDPVNGELWYDLKTHYDWDMDGQCIKLKTVVYAHCSKVNYKIGDSFKKGSIVALSGDKGLSSGPHLHLSFGDIDNQGINPEAMAGFILVQDEIDKLNEDLKKLQAEYDDLDARNTKKREKIAVLEANVEKLQSDYDVLYGEKVALEIKVTDMEDVIGKQDKKIKRQAEQITKLEKALQDCKSDKPDNVIVIIFNKFSKFFSKDNGKN